MIADSRRINYYFFLCWLLVTCWLLLSAFLTHGEYGDGYTTITNGRYLFGDSLTYNAQRGPLAALMMWPVELFINWTEWNLVDIRPYHFYSGFLHSLYLLGCWILLKYTSNSKHSGTARLLAFVIAILSVVFYSFAPYLNHDIIPGLLFLILIYLGHRWFNKPDIKTALWLVLIGSAATFIKQTFAIFWIVLILYALIAYVCRWDNCRVTARKLSLLFVLATFSGIISWIGYGMWLIGDFPNEYMIYRPLLMIGSTSERYGVQFSTLFSQDLYLRNSYNYGIGVLLLIVPGLISAFYKKESRLRMVAVCWLLSIVIMQLITFKEVRYLLFLAPLTAVLIVPVIQYVLKQRMLAFFLVAFILTDQARGWSLAARQISSTAGINVAEFIDASTNKNRLIVSRILTFIYMADSPLERDLYHGIYHLTARIVASLYENKIELVTIEEASDIGQIGIRQGDRIYWANTRTLRGPPWEATNNKPERTDQLMLISGDAQRVELVRNKNGYATKNYSGYSILFIPDKSVGEQAPILEYSGLTLEQAEQLYGDIQEQETLNVVAVIVKGICQAGQCNYQANLPDQ